MQTAGHKRPVVVDFLVTLFITFCIGVAASLALVGSVLLIAGDVRGEERCAGAAREGAPEGEMLARLSDLAITHHLATKYANLVAVERFPARPVPAEGKTEGAQSCPAPNAPGALSPSRLTSDSKHKLL